MPRREEEGVVITLRVPARLKRAIEKALATDSDFTISEWIRDAIGLRLKQEFPEIYARMRSGRAL
ncbi:MAG: hypothetical protein QXR87_05245 [Candidatus Hadarchaeales archaeon]